MNVTELIETVREWGSLPDIQSRYPDSEIIKYLNNAMIFEIVPKIIKVNEDYLRSAEYFPGNTVSIPIPSRAMGGALREISLWDSAHSQMLDRIPHINPDALYVMSRGYYIENNTIIFYPSTYTWSGDIKVSFIRRPNKLTSNSSPITTLTTSSFSVPYNFNFPVGSTVEFINSFAPFDSYGTAIVNTVTPGTIGVPQIITLGYTLPIGVTTGTYVSLQNESFVPQIPEDLHPLLVQSTVIKILESLGDAEGLTRAVAMYTGMETNAFTVMTPRVSGDLIAISPISGIGNYV